MADLTETFVRRLRKARLEKGWTQEELAHRSGLSARFIGKIEASKASPTIRALGYLADALNVDPGDLVKRKRRSVLE